MIIWNIIIEDTQLMNYHILYCIIINSINGAIEALGRFFNIGTQNQRKNLVVYKTKLLKSIEPILIEYMKENNHPGLNYKGNLITMFKIQQGKRVSTKKKTEQIQKILSKYQITQSNPLYNDIKQTLLHSTEREKIKFKKSK